MSAPLRRERIATAVLQGLIASGDGPNQPWSSTPSDTARTAIEVADALVEALDAIDPPQPPPARDPDMLGSAGVYQPSPRPAETTRARREQQAGGERDEIREMLGREVRSVIERASVDEKRRWASEQIAELDRRVGTKLWSVGCGESAASDTITTLRAELDRVRGERDTARDELARTREDIVQAVKKIQYRIGAHVNDTFPALVDRLLARMESDQRLSDEARARAENIAKERSEAADRLTAERDAAVERERRVQQKLTDLFEQWAHKPTNGPHEYGRRQGVLSAAETIRVALTPPTGETCRGELDRVRADLTQAELEQAKLLLHEVKVAEDSDEGPVRISWNGKEWAQASALTEAESELNRAYDCLNHWKGEADKLRAELELVRGELSEAREIAARNARDCEHLRQSAIELTTERDAARASLARLRAKVGPVVEWWRAYTPVLVDMRRIVPVFARRLDVLKSGWED